MWTFSNSSEMLIPQGWLPSPCWCEIRDRVQYSINFVWFLMLEYNVKAPWLQANLNRKLLLNFIQQLSEFSVINNYPRSILTYHIYHRLSNLVRRYCNWRTSFRAWRRYLKSYPTRKCAVNSIPKFFQIFNHPSTFSRRLSLLSIVVVIFAHYSPASTSIKNIAYLGLRVLCDQIRNSCEPWLVFFFYQERKNAVIDIIRADNIARASAPVTAFKFGLVA